MANKLHRSKTTFVKWKYGRYLNVIITLALRTTRTKTFQHALLFCWQDNNNAKYVWCVYVKQKRNIIRMHSDITNCLYALWRFLRSTFECADLNNFSHVHTFKVGWARFNIIFRINFLEKLRINVLFHFIPNLHYRKRAS